MSDETAEGWLRRNIAGPLYTACIQTAVTMSEADDSKEPLECLGIVCGGVIEALTKEVEEHGDHDLSAEISLRHERDGEKLG